MSFMKSIQKKIFGKTKDDKSPIAASSSASTSASFNFESVFYLVCSNKQDLLKRDLTNIDTLSKEELVELIQSCMAEYNAYVTASKGIFS